MVAGRDQLSSRPATAVDLSIVAADGSSPATRLLAPGLTSSMGAWSPDGTQIAFVGAEATGDTGLYVVDVGRGSGLAGGLQARRITDAGTDVDWFDPRWSPDGTELAASAGTDPDCILYDSGTLDTFLMKADGSDQRTLAAETAKEYYPTWSPDGHRSPSSVWWSLRNGWLAGRAPRPRG